MTYDECGFEGGGAKLEGPRIMSLDPTSMVAMVRIPPPRHLVDGMGEQHACALRDAYKAMLMRRVGIHCFGMRGSPAGWKQYKGLVACAIALMEARIPPAAWCQFRFDCHRQAKIPGNPTIGWVFSAKAVADRGDWYERQRGKYEGARDVMAPAHRALVEDWRRVVDDPGSIEHAAERAFPAGSFVERLESAVVEQRVEQARVNAEVRAWGWPVVR